MVVFKGIDLTKEDDIQWLAWGLASYLAGHHRRSNNIVMRECTAVQLSTFLRILGQIQIDEVFDVLIQALIHSVNEDDDELMFRLARNLLDYQEEEEVSHRGNILFLC